MRKNIQLITTGSIIIAIGIFAFIIVRLFDRGDIVFTDQDTVTEPVIRRNDPFIGSTNPTSLLVLYSNFTCINCRDASNVIRRLVSDYNITVVWKHFPDNQLNPESERASIAAYCAHEQGYFWDFHDILHSNRDDLGPDVYTSAVEALGMRERKFNRCMESDESASYVNDSLKEASDLNLTAAPTLYVDTERFTGQLDEIDLRELLDNLEAAAQQL